jgi:hypothetical protein
MIKYYKVLIEYPDYYEYYVRAKDKKTAEMKAIKDSSEEEILLCEAKEIKKKEYDKNHLMKI